MTTPVKRVRFRGRHIEQEDIEPEQRVQSVGRLEKKKSTEVVKEGRRVRIDDVLWLLAFILTMWYFDVPCTIWPYLQAAAALWLGFFAIGIFFIAILGQSVEPDDWKKAYPRLFPLATSLYLLSCIAFCYAVWPVWSGWSLLIVFVSSIFSIIVVSLFP